MDRRRVRPATCASGWDLGRRRDVRRLIGAGICVFRRRRAGNGSIVRQGEILGVRIATIIKHSAMNDGAKMGVLMRGVQEHRRIQESPRVSGDGICRRKYSSAFSMNLGPCNHRMKFDDLGMKLEPQRTRVQGNKEIERKWLAAAALSVTKEHIDRQRGSEWPWSGDAPHLPVADRGRRGALIWGVLGGADGGDGPGRGPEMPEKH
ncbi:hypothetical protein B0H10DRAFT_2193330 [Mycena sp. CBHHK59/15]|nr:hypothetical protein B0H10DRAFT_2193330 [Mycena sp. CBHHK59/15]